MRAGVRKLTGLFPRVSFSPLSIAFLVLTEKMLSVRHDPTLIIGLFPTYYSDRTSRAGALATQVPPWFSGGDEQQNLLLTFCRSDNQ